MKLVLERASVFGFVENPDQLKSFEQAFGGTNEVKLNQRSVHRQVDLRENSLSVPS